MFHKCFINISSIIDLSLKYFPIINDRHFLKSIPEATPVRAIGQNLDPEKFCHNWRK